MVKELYNILKLTNENATKSEIKRAYINLVLKHHPDKGGSEAEFIKINKAYEVLIDENKKREYDDGNENVEVEEYGYDYGEPIPEEGPAVVRYRGFEYSDYLRVYSFYTDFAELNGIAQAKGEESPIISDYHLVRAKKALQIVNSYYKPIYEKIGWNKFKEQYCELGSPLAFMSSWSSWDGPVKQFKDALNFARGKMGLNQLTDSDLKLKSIEGNNQNETPQIPGNNNEPDKIKGNEEPKQIKDGVADIKKYNESFWLENNETVRKFSELRGKIYNEWEEFKRLQKVNASLFKQIDDKDKEVQAKAFQTIWDTDEADKISEIKVFNQSKLEKMDETIKLMESLLAEGENTNNKEQNNSVSEPTNNKRKAETEAYNENAKKSRTIADELSKLITEAKSINNSYEELETKIKEIDKYQGEEVYNLRQGEINQLKVKLGSLDKDKFRTLTIQKVKSVMADNQIEESGLDQETKDKLAELEKEEDINKITELGIEIGEKVGKKGALNTLNDWLKRAKELVEGVKKGTIKHLREELNKAKEGLYNFQFSTNAYQKGIFKDKENDVKQMLEKLENHAFQNTTQPPKSSFFRPGVIIPLGLLVAAVVVGSIVIVRKKRRQAKAK